MDLSRSRSFRGKYRPAIAAFARQRLESEVQFLDIPNAPPIWPDEAGAFVLQPPAS